MTIYVRNLTNNEVLEFSDSIGNIEALVTAAMLNDNKAYLLVDEQARQEYRDKIEYSSLTARIDNLTVLF